MIVVPLSNVGGSLNSTTKDCTSEPEVTFPNVPADTLISSPVDDSIGFSTIAEGDALSRVATNAAVAIATGAEPDTRDVAIADITLVAAF